MEHIFAQQCTDGLSGKIGCFTFDKEQANKDGYFKATSPVFADTYEFFRWCEEQGIKLSFYEPYNFPQGMNNTRASI